MTDVRGIESTTPAKRNTSEKGRAAALARHAAIREQRAAEEAIEQAIGGRAKSKMKAKSVRVEDVPPFSYLATGRTPEEAVIEAIKHFSITPVEALVLVWKLRATRQADHISAENTAQTFYTKPVQSLFAAMALSLPTTLPTNRPSICRFERLNEQSSPQATVGKRSQPARKKEKDTLASSAKQSP